MQRHEISELHYNLTCFENAHAIARPNSRASDWLVLDRGQVGADGPEYGSSSVSPEYGSSM